MAASPKYADLSDSITSGLANIRKWYGKTDDTDAYFVCLGTRFFHAFNTAYAELYCSTRSKCQSRICTEQVGFSLLQRRHALARESGA